MPRGVAEFVREELSLKYSETLQNKQEEERTVDQMIAMSAVVISITEKALI